MNDIEIWRKVMREGIAPSLTTAQIEAWLKGVTEDDPRMMQGATTTPPPLQSVMYWDCEGACGIAYAGWQGDGLSTVAQVEGFFVRLCFEAEQRMGINGVSKYFINWFDDTPRPEMRRQLAIELRATLAERLTPSA